MFLKLKDTQSKCLWLHFCLAGKFYHSGLLVFPLSGYTVIEQWLNGSQFLWLFPSAPCFKHRYSCGNQTIVNYYTHVVQEPNPPWGDIRRLTDSSTSRNSSFLRYLIPCLLQLICPVTWLVICFCSCAVYSNKNRSRHEQCTHTHTHTCARMRTHTLPNMGYLPTASHASKSRSHIMAQQKCEYPKSQLRLLLLMDYRYTDLYTPAVRQGQTCIQLV